MQLLRKQSEKVKEKLTLKNINLRICHVYGNDKANDYEYISYVKITDVKDYPKLNSSQNHEDSLRHLPNISLLDNPRGLRLKKQLACSNLIHQHDSSLMSTSLCSSNSSSDNNGQYDQVSLTVTHFPSFIHTPEKRRPCESQANTFFVRQDESA